MKKELTIADMRHPHYTECVEDWFLWRNTYESGKYFIDQYLRQLSERETADDFSFRKSITYCPAFAKEAVVEIKNSIYQRFNDITRIGGPKSYQEAIRGDLRGVDLIGSSMNSFIGQQILPELLVMRSVGAYMDMPSLTGQTMRDKAKKRPYIYRFCVEDICCWSCDNSDDPNEFTKILLREDYDTYDPVYDLPTGSSQRYRFMYKIGDGTIGCRFFDGEGKETQEEILLNLSMVPFVTFEIDHSLLQEVARYQIALLNLASSDMSYAIKANFPFYIEQYDPRSNSPHLKPAAGDGSSSNNQGRENEIRVGVTKGRRYGIETDPPAFINPSPDPLRVSMEKQEQLKQEIRQLVQLAVASLNPNKQASAESKSLDNQGLEAGLSYIGLELERGERRLAQFWSMYESSKEVATINYPEKYSLKSDAQRNDDAKNITTLATKIPSPTAQKEMTKEAARILLCSKVPVDVLRKIETEIDQSEYLTSDYEQIAKDVEMGLVDKKTASKARGYPEGCVEKASKEHAERLAAIAKHQGSDLDKPGARGVKDADENGSSSGREEKAVSRKTDTDAMPSDKTRGSGQYSKGE